MTTPADDVVEALRRAQDAVERAGVAEDLREAAFGAAFAAFTGANTPAGVSASEAATAAKPPARGAADGLSALERIATAVGVTSDALSYIYEEDGEDLRLVISRTLLPNPRSRAAAMRDVAQLVMAGRQLGGVADWTSYERLRDECEELSVLDRGNFATEIQTLDLRVQGGRRSREARLTRHGIDQAVSLIRQMIEGMAT